MANVNNTHSEFVSFSNIKEILEKVKSWIDTALLKKVNTIKLNGTDHTTTDGTIDLGNIEGGSGDSPVTDVKDEWNNSLITNKIAKLNNYSKILYIDLDKTSNDDWGIENEADGPTVYGSNRYIHKKLVIYNTNYSEYFISTSNTIRLTIEISSEVEPIHELKNGTRIYTNGPILPAFERHYGSCEGVLVYNSTSKNVKTGWTASADPNGTNAYRNSTSEMSHHLYPFGRFYAEYIYWWGAFYGSGGYGNIKVTNEIASDCVLPVTSEAVSTELSNFVDTVYLNGVKQTMYSNTEDYGSSGRQVRGRKLELNLGQYSYLYLDNSKLTTDLKSFTDPNGTEGNIPSDAKYMINLEDSVRYVSIENSTGGVYLYLMLDNWKFNPGHTIEISLIGSSSRMNVIMLMYRKSNEETYRYLLKRDSVASGLQTVWGNGTDRPITFRLIRASGLDSGWDLQYTVYGVLDTYPKTVSTDYPNKPIT